MSGLDRIIKNIEDDAKAKCDSILKEAQDKAAQIIEAAQAQAKQESETLLREAETKLAAQKSNAVSGALLKQRNSLLQAKQEMMDEAMAQAKAALDGLPAEEYFNALFSLALRYAQNKEGEMLLSARDLPRLPEDFAQRVNRALDGRGSIRVCPQPRAIKNGFVLVYGHMEENCTFDALFEAQEDALRDKLQGILF